MKSVLLSLAAFLASVALAAAVVKIDDAAFGKTLGGWKHRSGQAAEYPLSGATYRTYKPEISPTPDGGLFVSVRIDHVRGWLSSDDHAMLEITINSQGLIESAQSNIAIQGRSITSDVILGANDAGRQIAVGTDRAVQIGTDLVANLSAKLLREKIVEAGRVSFPAAIRHNYNLLFQAIRVEQTPVATIVPLDPPAGPPAPEETTPSPPPAPEEPAAPSNSSLEIKPYGTPKSGPVGPEKK
jgi:hypothetical protein